MSTTVSGWVYFSYPLEVECMEGTNWIAALAFREGRNPYFDPGLAFLNMNHGPLDAPVKAFITVILPWLDSWQVIRLPGLLLPFALVLVLRDRGGNLRPRPWRWSIAAGLSAYFVMQSSGNLVTNMGRSDALMLLLLTLLLPIGRRLFGAEDRVRTGWVVLFGIIAAAAFLENFRAAIVLPSFVLLAAFDSNKDRFRPAPVLLRCLGAGFFGAAMVFAAVLGGVFHFDFGLYFRHSLGFFLGSNGHGLSGLPRWRDLVVPFLDNRLWLLLPLALIGSLLWRTRTRAAWLGAVTLGFPFVAFLGAYATNHVGAAGGLHYFAPLAIIALLLWQHTDWNETRDAAGAVTVIAVALLSCNWRVVVNNTALLWHTRHEATAFNRYVRDLESRTSVESQDIHLFETRVRPTEVDLGLLGYPTHQPGSAAYYAKFTRSFEAHLARLHRDPPGAIVVGDFPSDELSALLRAGSYVPVRESPPRIYNAENLTRTRVYLRRSLLGDLPILTNPAPQFRTW